MFTSEVRAIARPPDLGDTGDHTLATELQAALPAQDDASVDLDQTQYADPVEQAILVDRTRPRSERVGAGSEPPPVGPSRRSRSGDPVAPRFALASPQPAQAPADPGPLVAATGQDLLGNYRVIAPIAAGGMGLLYLGEHNFLGYRVAIKILQPTLRGNADVERRFFAEAVATARIAHPGVPTVLDYGHDRNGTAYLIMEYLEGETLAAHMSRGECFTLAQILDMGSQLANILATAHSRGVLHRDIKPDNVHLTPDRSEPSGFRIKLLDFGVAKLLSDKPPDAASTRHDYLVGTAWYMAPEQTFGPTGVDARSDVYAVGCVLFQLLCGRLPFCGEFEEVVQARRYQDPPPPRAFRPDLPRAIDSLIHRMLSRAPDQRPASMGDVERELRSILFGLRAAAAGESVALVRHRGAGLRAMAARAVARCRAALRAVLRYRRRREA